MFPFWAPGSVLPPRRDGPRSQCWAPLASFTAKAAPITKLPSCSFSGSWVGWMVHGILIALYADKSLPISFSKCARPSSCFSCTTATQCVFQALLHQNPAQYARRPTCGKNRDRFRVKKPLQPHTWHIKAVLQQNPVQHARRRVCGKNRDRFRLKKPFCLSCKPTNLNPNLLQQTYAAAASMLQQLQQNVLFSVRGFSQFQRRKKCRQVSSYCFCQVDICAAKFPLIPVRQPSEQNAKRFVFPPQTYTANATYPSVSQGDSLQRLREKCGLFPCGGCCGAQILCATIFVRSAEKIDSRFV